MEMPKSYEIFTTFHINLMFILETFQNALGYYMGSSLAKSPFLRSIRKFTLGKGLMSALNVASSLAVSPASSITGEFTLGKGLTSAVHAGEPSAVTLTSFVTRECTPRKGPMNAASVGKPLVKDPHLFDTR